MPACPACLGDGHHDFTEEERLIRETWTVGELQAAMARGYRYPLGVVECEECEGTGIVSVEREKDLRAHAVAAVDQALAKLREEDEFRNRYGFARRVLG